MQFLSGAKRDDGDERLLWSRDIRFAHRLAETLPTVRVVRARRRDRRHRAGSRPDRRPRGRDRRGRPLAGLRPRHARSRRCPRASATSSRCRPRSSSRAWPSGSGWPSRARSIQTKMLDYFFTLQERPRASPTSRSSSSRRATSSSTSACSGRRCRASRRRSRSIVQAADRHGPHDRARQRSSSGSILERVGGSRPPAGQPASRCSTSRSTSRRRACSTASSRPRRSPTMVEDAGLEPAPDHPRVHRAAGRVGHRPARQAR